MKNMDKENEMMVKLEGEKTTLDKIDARPLGNFLLDFQSVIERITIKSGVKERTTRDQSRLFPENSNGEPIGDG